MKFAVFYGVPTYRTDNIWLHEELSKYGDTRVIEVSDFWYMIGRFRPRSKLGIGIHVIMYFIQAVMLILRTNTDDIVFTRDHGSSLIMACLTKVFTIKRKIIAFNWIEMPKKHYKKIADYALKNDDYIPVVNDKRMLADLKDAFQLKNVKGVFFPDLYDTRDVFIKPKMKQEKYVFCGGVNNRDWETVIEVAQKNKHIMFKFVVSKYCWKYKRYMLPDNIEIFFDLDEDKYYKILRESCLSIVPLKYDKVSGLINIIKSHQYGIPCITNAKGVASTYIPYELRNLLQYGEEDKVECISKIINLIYDMDEKHYLKICDVLQNYLKEEFSPTILMRKLMKHISGEYDEFFSCGGSI